MIATSVGGLDPASLGSGWTIAAFFALLFSLSFLFSGTETAFFSLQEIDRRRIREGATATHRRIANLMRDRTALITTILMGNETVNIAISATAAALLAVWVPGRPWVAVLVVTPILVLFSEITPKILAFRYNRLWVDVAVWPLSVLKVLLWLPRLVVGTMVSLLARLFGVTGQHTVRAMGETEFLAFLSEGEKQGVVEEHEREFIEAVFNLDDLPIVRVMTPRPDMFSLPLDIPWDELMEACRHARFSRVPIYEENPDNIVGVLLVKDLLRHRRRPLRSPEELRRILLPPEFVPDTKPANQMMKDMLKRRFHMAFVVDEHGSTIGLVSLDDLIIELVGEIEDPEEAAEPEDIRVEGEGWLVRGSVDVEDLAEHTPIQLPEGEYHTVGGFLMAALGRVPDVGDVLDHDGYSFRVTEVDGRRIVDVQVAPLGNGAPSEASA